MATLYADENVPFPLVRALAVLGHDILTALADGRAHQGIDDPNVLSRATSLGRAVLTNNRMDYHRLHRNIQIHAGIITYTNDHDIAGLAARIDATLASFPSLEGLLIKVIRPNPSRKP